MRGVTMLAAGVLLVVTGAPAAPVPKDAGKLPPPTEEQMIASEKNMKQIILAFHNYASVEQGLLPNNSYTKAGKPLLSWRVHILPYIEEGPLYKQFKRDEPWDGEVNKKLVEKMPKLYAPIRVKAKDGMTFYRGFAGEQALFGPGHGPTGLGNAVSAIADGTSNTGAVFEAAEPVVWTKPDGLAFDPEKKVPALGGMFDGVFHVGMCDGTVIRCRKDADEKELKKLIMPADGETVYFDKLEAK